MSLDVSTQELSIVSPPHSWVGAALRGRWSGPIVLLGTVLGGVGLLGMTLALLRAPVDYRAIGEWGYLGIFLVTLIATAAIVLPLPYVSLIIVAGTFLDPLLVAVVAGLGVAIGELTIYALGRGGRSWLTWTPRMARLEAGVQRWGTAATFLASLIPNPFFKGIGLLAGGGKVPVWKFLLACFVGRTLRFWFLAAFGASFLA